jgi:hypothetical protein
MRRAAGVAAGLVALAAVFVLAAQGGCASPTLNLPPFRRGEIDDRDPARVAIRSVADDGTFVLADGRTVRVFGVDPPADPEARARYVSRASRFVGEEASVRIVQDGVPPAAELLAWRNWMVCGNGMLTWNPFDPPIRTWAKHDVASDLAWNCGGAVRASDLADPRVPADVVRALRR